MSLLNEIREDQIAARKARLTERASILTTLLSEAANVGLNDGKRETTDVEVVAVVKKFIKGLDETLVIPNIAVDVSAKVQAEHAIISEYLPSQLNAGELTDIAEAIVEDIVERLELNGPEPKMMGEVMKTLKANYGGQYDGKLASAVVKGVLAP